jgi:hypothetical protein
MQGNLSPNQPRADARLGLCSLLCFLQGTGQSLKKLESLIQNSRSLGTVRSQLAQLLLLVRVFPVAHGLADPCLLLSASLQAQVVLSFQAYPIARCALLEVQVPADLVQPGQSVVCEGLLLRRRATSRIPDSLNNLVHCFLKSWV